MLSWPSVSMMSTAMSRSLLSYSRAWCPQKTRSLPLARTTRTLANAPQRSQWKGTTRSSAGGVVVSVWVIWVITRSLPHGPAAADRPPAQRQDVPLCSRPVRSDAELAEDGEGGAGGACGAGQQGRHWVVPVCRVVSFSSFACAGRHPARGSAAVLTTLTLPRLPGA